MSETTGHTFEPPEYMKYLEAASFNRYEMQTGRLPSGEVTVRMEADYINRMITLTHLFPGSTIGDHIRAAVLWYSDEQCKDPAFVEQVEEQSRLLDEIQFPAR